MGFPKVFFKIIENTRCPLYTYGDVFSVTGIAICMTNNKENSSITTSVINAPEGKEPCRILNGDLTRIIMQYERSDKIPVCLISCTGCSGSVKLEHNHKHDLVTVENDGYSNEIGSIMHLFSDFAFFKNIDKKNLDKVIHFFSLNTYKKGDIVIRTGAPSENFFIIVTGSVNVINDAGITISTLQKGDVFGEMSLICNDRASATIQVREDTSILSIDQSDFRKILDHFPTVQLYFSRLIAGRLNKANTIPVEDLTTGMIGNLSEIPAEALFQTLNMNSKTGILTVNQLSKGTARCSFRQGTLIKATYNGVAGEEAFYDILKEHKGRFRFTPGIPTEDFELPEIGYFMKLLMEGLRRIDEEKNKSTNCAA